MWKRRRGKDLIFLSNFGRLGFYQSKQLLIGSLVSGIFFFVSCCTLRVSLSSQVQSNCLLQKEKEKWKRKTTVDSMTDNIKCQFSIYLSSTCPLIPFSLLFDFSKSKTLISGMLRNMIHHNSLIHIDPHLIFTWLSFSSFLFPHKIWSLEIGN